MNVQDTRQRPSGRIDLSAERDVSYWCAKLGVSPVELKHLVGVAGERAEDVENYMARAQLHQSFDRSPADERAVEASDAVQSREIAKEDWSVFLDRFSREHEGWLSSVEVDGPGAGPRTPVREEPLAGVTADVHRAGKPAIAVLVGMRTDRHVGHLIEGPQRVRLQESEGGVHHALEIDSEGGMRTVVKFRAAAAPEQLDGYAPDAAASKERRHGR